MAEKKPVGKKPSANVLAAKKAVEKKPATAKKTAAAKKPAAKTPSKSEDEIAFGKALEKLGKLKYANKEALYVLYKAGIARGKALAKK